jgi:hypothetical protein
MTNDKELTIIEINGIKLEVDLRTARKIENYKVGDTVKLLVKKYDKYETKLGVIVDFDAFEHKPTIVIAYLEHSYNDTEIKIANINSENNDYEICPLSDWFIPFSKQDVLNQINENLNKKNEEIKVLENKKRIFLEMFGKYFQDKIGFTVDNK